MGTASLRELSTRLGRLLAARQWMLATAESCTGGWLSMEITAVAGSSAWFDRGFVTYSNDAKRELLGVKEDTLAAHGAVSEPVAREMAEGAIARSRAQAAVAITGIAGPGGGSAQKPVGTVCIAWSLAGRGTVAQTHHFEGDRESVRRQSVVHALTGLIDQLEKLA